MRLNHLIQIIGATGLLLSACSRAPENTEASAQASPPAEFKGQVYEVKMRGTAKGFYFEPNTVTIKKGDKVHFALVDGGPHNVHLTEVPPAADVKLEANGMIMGQLLQVPGQTTDLLFSADLPAGEYNFVCDPHKPLGMKGKIVVTE